MCPTHINRSPLITNQFATTLILAVAILIAGCSDSAQVSNDSDVSQGALSGSVSAGLRTIPENSVIEIQGVDTDGATAAIDSTGKFEFENTTGPAILRLDTGDGQILYAIAPENNVAINVHSYSDFVARNYFASRGLNIEDEFTSTEPLTNVPDQDEFTNLSQQFSQVLAGILEAYQLSDIDLLTEPFIADGTSIDGFLIANPLVVSGDDVTLTITDPVTMTQSTLFGDNSSSIDINTNLTAQNDNPPEAPTAIRVLPAGEQQLVVLWDPARDDRGIANYRIFRDGVLLDTSPFPTFTDSSLNFDTEYSYQIESIDSSGQSSARSISVAGRTTLLPDVVAPPPPIDVIAVVNNGTINVEWNQQNIDDVARFSVARDVSGQTIQRLVTTTSIDDLDVTQGVEHCYSVESIDGFGNRSASSERTCVTLPSPGITPPVINEPAGLEPIFSITDCGSIPVSNIAPSNDVDLPVLFGLDTLTTGALDSASATTNRHFWDVNVTPGGYFLVVDFTRSSGATTSFNVTTLSPLGSEQSRILQIIGTDQRARLAVFLTVEDEDTLRLQFESGQFGGAGSYTMGLFRNGSAVPSPYFNNCPIVVTLGIGTSESISLGSGQDGYALIGPADVPSNLIVDSVRQSGATTSLGVEARFRFSEQSSSISLGQIITADANDRFVARLNSIENADFAWIRFNNSRFGGNLDIEFRLDPN